MKSKTGLTVIERINKDIDLAERADSEEYKRLLAYMALSAAEFAIDFDLIPKKEWSDLTERIFRLI